MQSDQGNPIGVGRLTGQVWLGVTCLSLCVPFRKAKAIGGRKQSRKPDETVRKTKGATRMISQGARVETEFDGSTTCVENLSAGDTVVDYMSGRLISIHELRVRTLFPNELGDDPHLNLVRVPQYQSQTPYYFAFPAGTPMAFCELCQTQPVSTDIDYIPPKTPLVFYQMFFVTSVLCKIGDVYLKFGPAHWPARRPAESEHGEIHSVSCDEQLRRRVF